jgi:hypothetical protein
MPKKKVGGVKKSALSVVVFMFFCAIFLFYVTFHINHSITGDEPNYVMMDYDMVHNHSLNLKNVFAKQEYRSFFPSYLAPIGQVDDVQLKDNSPKLYSEHGVGLPILIMPAYILNGVKAIEVEMVLVSLLAVWLTYVWTNMITGNRTLSFITTGILTTSLFFSGLAGYIYPDIPIATLVLGALILLYKYYDRFWPQFAFGVVVGMLPFFHLKTLSIAGPLMLIMLYRYWKYKKRLPWAALISFIPLIILFFICEHAWFGVWDPSTQYSLGTTLTVKPVNGVSAMLFDYKMGFLTYCPIMLLVFVGLMPWAKKNLTSLSMAILTLLPTMALLTVFNGWQGGASPPGRYFMEFIPALMPAMAFALDSLKKYWQKAIVAILLVISLAFTIEMIVTKPPHSDDTQTQTQPPLFVSIQNQTGLKFQIDKLFPKYTEVSTNPVGSKTRLKAAIGCAIVLGMVGYGYVLVDPVPLRLHVKLKRS